MKNRLFVDIYWCALSSTWCCKTFTMMHAQNIVIQKIFVRAEGDAAASPASPWIRYCKLVVFLAGAALDLHNGKIEINILHNTVGDRPTLRNTRTIG